MKCGPHIEVEIPEQLNLATYYLDENISKGRGDKIAVYCQDEKYTFNEMVALTNRFGNVLKEFGVGFEDRVMMILQDSPEWLAGWFATMKIGGIATHAYTYLLPSDYEYFFNYVRPKVVIADATTLDRVREGARNSMFPRTILVARTPVPELQKGEHDLAKLLEKTSALLEAAPTSKNDFAFWNFSGGTTGKSKAVPHMHHDGLLGFESYQQTVQYTPDDIVFRVPKLFFHYSRDLGMNWALRAGAAVALYPDRSTVDSVYDCIAKYRPTVLLNVPTMMRSMLQSPRSQEIDFSGIRLSISSGELLSGPLYEEFTKKFKVEVLNCIGSAETCIGYFLDAPGEVAPGSAGKVQPLCEVKLLDREGKEVPQGETGILYVRSDAVGTYYHLEHEKSKKTFVGDDWVNSNDLFREDENGYWWYSGRADDLVKVSGVYVSPLEIEKCLEGNEMVKECVVVPVKDKDGLDRTKAFIVLRPGVDESEGTADVLKEFCKQKMASFKAPRLIQFVPELPKTGQGKIDKRQLLQQYS
ncbi:MAG: 4-hydroxybenzoate--CoA/benzoate--CoA ligase [Syntrophorhabdaceae bacterium PtaU1.Bin034]|jgi:benzoate-CoA ligase|nr:MAG: 4-hydroxybenzoate--CoA/benzoate--CoA ligase [Syntrophorhabdaceae bacterium PtaU1.Bin034]